MSLKRRRNLLRVLFWVVSILMTAFVLGGFFLPRHLKVTRTMAIRSEAVAVFDRLQSFRQWESWAPWFRRDRFIEKNFGGPESGIGAMMAWKSKSEGEGRIKIISASIPNSLNMAVEFGDRGEADTWFEIRDGGGGNVSLTWGFQTDFGQNMARRYFGLLLRPQVERDLGEGLENLKALMEKPAGVPSPETGR
jgi:Polyketide cyclase / dehydrase and lipid transport